jgi:hypothetical protein
VYGPAPDDWSPFADGKSILSYVKDAGYEAVSRTSLVRDWTDGAHVSEEIKKADLLLIDPLFLARSDLRSDVFARLDATIHASERAFCLARHRGIPAEIYEQMDTLCRAKLPSCLNWYSKGSDDSEFRVEDVERLEVALRRLLRCLLRRRDESPHPGNLAASQAILSALGAQFTGGNIPVFGSRQ